MAKPKHVIWCTSLHGFIKPFWTMQTLHQKSPTALVKKHNSAIEANVGRVIVCINSTCLLQMLTLLTNQGHSIMYYNWLFHSCQFNCQKLLYFPPEDQKRVQQQLNRSKEFVSLTIVFLTRIATVDMVLWDDARIIPCNSQLWAIQCTWSG